MGWLAIQQLMAGASELSTATATTGTGGSLGGAIGYGRTIATGFPAYLPASFAKSRFNHLVIVNGLKRGLFWDGVSGAAENLGIEAAEDAPGVSVADGGNSEEGEYTLAYRYIDSRGIPGDLSPVTAVTAAPDDLFNWTLPHPSEGRITKIQTYRSLVGVADPLYLVSNHTIGGQVYASTTASAGAATNIATLIPHSLAGTETVILSGHSEATLNGTGYTPTVVDNYNFTIPVAFTANGFGGTFTRVLGSLSYSDTMSDETLGERDVLVITEVGGELGARAHHPPPQNKMVVAQFQDRMWYGGDPEYDEGTVSYTHNSSTITGSGTNWTSAMEGRYFYLRNPDTSYRAQYIVSAVNSATSLTLDQPYMGTTASGLSYVIANDPIERNQLSFSEVDSPESVPLTNVLVIQENTGDDDRIVGLMPYGSALFVLKERHIYRMTFVRQPIIDANVNLVCSRGVFNHRCWDTYEGVSYLMDQHGCYAFDTAEPVPLSAPIQNYFREGLIDLAYSKWFHVKVDPRLEVVRFYVKFTADTGTRPKRALVYNIRSGAWWIETYVCEIGDAVQATVSGVLRAIFGTATNADLFFTHSSGTADGVSAAIRGTVTSAAAGTLVDSSAPFTSGSNPKPGSSVAILTGTGSGQVREITAFPSNTTTLSISPVWTTTPDTTSTYAVGAVPWSLKTKVFSYVGTYPSDKKEAERNERGIYITHQPTTNAHYWDLARYLNHSATAESAGIDRTFGDGWSQTSGSSGVRYDMRSARSSFGTSTGLAHFRFPDGQEPSSPGSPKFVTLELNGFQVDEQIIIYDILVDGGE